MTRHTKKSSKANMFKSCGQKCFLGSKKSKKKYDPGYPICTNGTCKVCSRRLYNLYSKSKKMEKFSKRFKKIARTAKKLLKKRGFNIL